MTEATAYTTGPWAMSRATDIKIEIAGMSNAHVCTVYTGGGPYAELLANARLIAAAPSLLAACEEALEAIRVYPGRGHPMTASEIIIHMAVKKARGWNYEQK